MFHSRTQISKSTNLISRTTWILRFLSKREREGQNSKEHLTGGQQENTRVRSYNNHDTRVVKQAENLCKKRRGHSNKETKRQVPKEKGRQKWKVVLEETTSDSDSNGGMLTRKKPPLPQKKEKQAVEGSVGPDPEEEVRSPFVDIATSSTDGEAKIMNTSEQLRATGQKSDGDEKKGIEQNPKEETFPKYATATAKWEVETKPQSPPKRVLERVREPTKRCGIFFVQLDTESDGDEAVMSKTFKTQTVTVTVTNCVD